MSNKRINISIENPCGENFKDFERTTKGGFCKNCNKEVIDFTRSSDRELLNFFGTNSQRVCGQFRPDQLGTINQVSHSKGTRLPLIAAAFGILSTLINTESIATGSNKNVTQEISIQEREPVQCKKTTIKNPVIISGQVIDENDNSGLPGASIVIKGKNKGTVTDIDGNFELTINDSNSALVLVISFVGYEDKEIVVHLTEPNINLGTIKVPLSISVLGEVCIVRKWSPRGIWHRITNIFRK